MSKKLAANVYVDGELYAAGSTPPKEIADQITNPKAWDAAAAADATDADDDGDKPAPAKKTTSRRSSGS